VFGTEMNFRSFGPHRKHTDAPELTSSHYATTKQCSTCT